MPYVKLTPVEKKCDACGKTFYTSRSTRRFCSSRCYTWFWNHTRTCQHCGKKIPPDSDHKKYCSDECRLAHQRVEPKEAICQCCGKKFFVLSTGKKYCSEKCRDTARENYLIARDEEKRANRKNVSLVCPACGEEFSPVQNNQKYCSVECRNTVKNETYRSLRRDYLPEKPRDPNRKTVEQWQKEAELCGLSYGYYRSQVERFGKTFEQLRIAFLEKKISGE